LPLVAFWCSFLGTCLFLGRGGNAPLRPAVISVLFPPEYKPTPEDLEVVRASLQKHIVTSAWLAAVLPWIPSPEWGTGEAWSFLGHLALFIGLCYLGIEVVFYWVHRAAHTSWFYPLHAQHHSFDKPFAFAALYCSTEEFLFLNLCPVMMGPWLMGVPVVLTTIWLHLVGASIALGHAGLQLTSFHDSSFHYLHHMNPRCNFGGGYVMDQLVGTYCERQQL
jgi:sterol desaturase/sphingolipid hydroxylase (fatty acid hydroxylase superfamily)